jgi:PDZ domain-containing protein
MKPFRYYIFGLATALACLIAAELIWLPAPLQTGGGVQWIEMIDRLFYVLALVPLSWLAGAWLGFMKARKARRLNGTGLISHSRAAKALSGLLQLLRLVICALALAEAGLIFFASDKLLLVLIFVVAPVPFIFVDMLLSEALAASQTVRKEAAASQGTGSTAGRRRLLRMPKRSGTVLLITAALLAALLWPTGYEVTYPGMTLNMNRYAHVEGGESGGTINGVLVFDRPAVPADWLYARLLPLYTFEKIPDDEPPLTEAYTQVVMMKTDANSIAAAVAMQKSGVGGGITADGVRVIAIVKDSPAEQLLKAGDIIDKLDGHVVKTINEMTAYMGESVKPGQVVAVTLRRNGTEVQVDIPTRASADAPERAVFGISVQTELHLDIPRSVNYKRYMAHIGGPSHGAMLTLALIDQLTPGGVTRGIKVAGTGTIEADGSIGPVGGVPQKAYAISRTDADVFFVPAALELEARGAAPDLNIVPVKTIDDVLGWLAQNGK